MTIHDLMARRKRLIRAGECSASVRRDVYAIERFQPAALPQ